MKYEKRISLKSIAYELGVSVNTVSRALRDCDDISKATKEKVRKVAIELGYLPNSLVYSINNDKTKSVALVINNVRNYYFSIINDKLLFYLRAEGYLPSIICLFGNDFDAEIVKDCLYQRIDTIVTFVEPTKEALELASMNHLPVIVCGRKVSKRYCDSLYTDDIKGGGLAADYLIKKGAENFVYINVKGSECSSRRFEGFKNVLSMKKPHCPVKKINIEDFEPKIDDIMKMPNLGLFAYNDEHLYIVFEKLSQRNLDYSHVRFIGYDGVCEHIFGTIKIPSIAFDYDAIARECLKLVKLEREEDDKHISKCFDVHLEDIL